MSDEPVIYSEGLIFASVCAPSSWTKEQVAEWMRGNLTGTSTCWMPAEDPTFADGTPQPCPCPDDPARTHYLFNC